LWGANRLEEAERELKAAYDLDSKSPIALGGLAAFYGVNNRTAEAIPYLKAHGDVTGSADSRLALVDAYLSQKNMKDARAVLDALNAGGSVPAKLRLANLDFDDGQRERANKIVDEILAAESSNAGATIVKARFLMAEGKPADALALANAVLASYPRSSPARFFKATALEALNRPATEQLAAWREVLTLTPGSIAVKTKLIELHLALGDGAAAGALANEVLRVEPGSGNVRFSRAQALLLQGQLAQAERELNLVRQANPDSPQVHYLFGNLYSANGDSARARQSYERAVERDPGFVPALTRVIEADIRANQAMVALKRITDQLKRSPNDTALLNLAGATFAATGEFPEAEAALKKAIELDPSNFEAYAQLGNFYLGRNRLDEALQEYKEAAKRRPEHAVPARTMVGIILDLQQKPEEAKKEYQEALALDPRAAVAANNLAWNYAQSNDNLDVALQLAQTAKAQLPNSWQVSDTLGWLYYKKGIWPLAVTSLQQAITQNPRDPGAHLRLGLAHLRNGSKDDARKVLQRALEINPAFPQAAEARKALAEIKG
jgi:tetratricopeptide (TPR) repeat protein